MHSFHVFLFSYRLHCVSAYFRLPTLFFNTSYATRSIVAYTLPNRSTELGQIYASNVVFNQILLTESPRFGRTRIFKINGSYYKYYNYSLVSRKENVKQVYPSLYTSFDDPSTKDYSSFLEEILANEEEISATSLDDLLVTISELKKLNDDYKGGRTSAEIIDITTLEDGIKKAINGNIFAWLLGVESPVWNCVIGFCLIYALFVIPLLSFLYIGYFIYQSLPNCRMAIRGALTNGLFQPIQRLLNIQRPPVRQFNEQQEIHQLSDVEIDEEDIENASNF